MGVLRACLGVLDSASVLVDVQVGLRGVCVWLGGGVRGGLMACSSTKGDKRAEEQGVGRDEQKRRSTPMRVGRMV